MTSSVHRWEHRGPRPVPPWRPPAGPRPEAVALGVYFDAVRLMHPVADLVLALLGDRVGVVIEDRPYCYLLVPLHWTRTWPPAPHIHPLSTDVYVAMPPPHRQHPPGPHWRVPLSQDRYLTDPTTGKRTVLVPTHEVFASGRELPAKPRKQDLDCTCVQCEHQAAGEQGKPYGESP